MAEKLSDMGVNVNRLLERYPENKAESAPQAEAAVADTTAN